MNKRMREKARHKAMLNANRKRNQRRRPSWVAMGALVASATLGGRGVATAAVAAPADGGEPLAQALLFGRNRSNSLDEAWRAFQEANSLQALVAETRLRSGIALFEAPAVQAPPVRRFDIPAGILDQAIAVYEQVTGVRIHLTNDGIRSISTPAVAGMYTDEQALAELLRGTGVGFRFESPLQVTLELRIASEAVEVSGRAPRLSTPQLTEPLRDIPQTVNVITADVMQQQGAFTLRDVLRNVPGITFQAGEGGVPAGDQLTIRGFSARTDIFIDGVRDFGGYSRDSFNLQQVEVAKGPSSSLAGRGSTGGTINQVSKQPILQSAYATTLGAGNADSGRITLDVNQSLEDVGIENAAFRVNAMWTDAGVPGRDVVNGERWGLAPSLAFGVGTSKRVTLSYFRLDQDNVPEYGLPWVPVNTNPELEAYSNGAPPVDQSNFYGLKARDYEDTKTNLATAIAEFDINSGFTLRNLTRYGTTDRDSVITSPDSPASTPARPSTVSSSRATCTTKSSPTRPPRPCASGPAT